MLLEQLSLPSSPILKPQFSVEETIGAVAGQAAACLCQAMLDYRADGRMGSKSRTCGAKTLAMLYTLRRDNPLVDFEAAVRTYGKKALDEYLAGTGPWPNGTDAWLDQLLEWVLKCAAAVTAKRVH
jgi:hypothetical protein